MFPVVFPKFQNVAVGSRSSYWVGCQRSGRVGLGHCGRSGRMPDAIAGWVTGSVDWYLIFLQVPKRCEVTRPGRLTSASEAGFQVLPRRWVVERTLG